MNTLDIRDLVRFSEDEPRRTTLTEAERLWSEVVCLQGAQGVGPLRDEASDGLLVVLAGRVAAQVGKGRARMGQWESVVVPAGVNTPGPLLSIAFCTEASGRVTTVVSCSKNRSPPPDSRLST